jgi:transcriptional regulator with XRE-family HTH domain
MSAFGSEAQQQRLAGELKRLRARSGLSGDTLANRIGISQGSISRIEAGKQRVSVPLAGRWLDATDADAETRALVLALAERIITGPTSWEEAGEGGDTNLQPETAKFEAASHLLSFYMPAVIPGLLQTAAYARRMFSSGPEGDALPGIPKRVTDRLERQRILYDDSKRFRFVIPEAVLRWPYGPPGEPVVLDEHREQLARIEEVSRRPNVDLGILPLAPVAVWRLSGFVIYDEMDDDEPQVHLEWLTRPFSITDAGQLESTRQAFANLMGASATGDEARRLIAAAADGLRG